MKTCKQCSASFEITDADRVFYDKVSPVIAGKKYLVPEPTHCPNCRLQRRLSWRNERTMYWRKCDATGKKILSVFSPVSPFKVYDNDYWWSDQWDAKSYGRDIDFNRPFFEQNLTMIFSNNDRDASWNLTKITSEPISRSYASIVQSHFR